MLERLCRPSGREPDHEDVVAIVVGDAGQHEALGLHLSAEVGTVARGDVSPQAAATRDEASSEAWICSV